MGHVLRKENGDEVRETLKFNVEGRKKKKKRTAEEQVEERAKAGLTWKDANNGFKCSKIFHLGHQTFVKWVKIDN